ncbi:MAG: hypothetical protein E7399_05655 [Ruminococcaceae bacterium]|nr:hypothetical protein [Oscillospiraceae bacterium]
MQKNAEIGLLLDCYQNLITPRQADVLALYYEEDLSLTEITEHYTITRQAVLDLIRRGEKQLYYYEERLGLLKKKTRNRELLEQLRKTIVQLPEKCVDEILSLAEQME